MKKEEKKSLFQETVRDVIALGSLPFYIIVLIRTSMDANLRNNFNHLGLSLIVILFLFMVFWKWKFEIHAALVVPLLIFVSLYYNYTNFTIFASILVFLLLASLFYLKYDWKRIVVGLIVGGMASGISWWIV